jgi:hypothetical protein
VIPCQLCLESGSGEEIVYGRALFDGTGWAGGIQEIPVTFYGYWERNQYTGECEFVVLLNDIEVYRASCYLGASCRDPAGTVELPGGGEFRWYVKRDLPLPVFINPVTGCTEFFCGACDCACECLCVTLTEYGETYRERFCTEPSCEGPTWEGFIGYRFLTFVLDRDEATGACLFGLQTGTDEYEQPVFSYVSVADCKELDGTWDLGDGVIVTARCADCGCDGDTIYPCECRFEGPVGGFLADGTNGTCAIPGPAGTLANDADAIIPDDVKMWHPDWVCKVRVTLAYKITAFPPDCVDSDVSRIVVFVKKATDDTWPGVDDNVQVDEWYAVVYTSGTAGPISLVSMNYEFAQCCQNQTPLNPATSHLIWIEFFSVDFGPWSYDLKILNPVALATYGECT